MGFKDDVRAKAVQFEDDLNELTSRVSALEVLARRLTNGGTASTASDLPTRTPGASLRAATGVDYGAVAFGLAVIKRKVAAVGVGAQLQSEYRRAVQYFADVFAKSDPEFDADEFRRQAGA